MSVNFLFRTFTPESTIEKHVSDPVDSTHIQNLFGLVRGRYGASFPSGSDAYSLFGHSSGFAKKVCLSALSGSYSNATPQVGFHFACSLPNP